MSDRNAPPVFLDDRVVPERVSGAKLTSAALNPRVFGGKVESKQE